MRVAPLLPHVRRRWPSAVGRKPLLLPSEVPPLSIESPSSLSHRQPTAAPPHRCQAFLLPAALTVHTTQRLPYRRRASRSGGEVTAHVLTNHTGPRGACILLTRCAHLIHFKFLPPPPSIAIIH